MFNNRCKTTAKTCKELMLFLEGEALPAPQTFAMQSITVRMFQNEDNQNPLIIEWRPSKKPKFRKTIIAV